MKTFYNLVRFFAVICCAVFAFALTLLMSVEYYGYYPNQVERCARTATDYLGLLDAFATVVLFYALVSLLVFFATKGQQGASIRLARYGPLILLIISASVTLVLDHARCLKLSFAIPEDVSTGYLTLALAALGPGFLIYSAIKSGRFHELRLNDDAR